MGDGANEAAASIIAVLQAHPRLWSRTSALVRVDRRRWDVRLTDGGIVALPAANEIAAIKRLEALDESSRILRLGFARIDLRDPEMIVVRPRGPAARGASDDAGGGDFQ